MLIGLSSKNGRTFLNYPLYAYDKRDFFRDDDHNFVSLRGWEKLWFLFFFRYIWAFLFFYFFLVLMQRTTYSTLRYLHRSVVCPYWKFLSSNKRVCFILSLCLRFFNALSITHLEKKLPVWPDSYMVKDPKPEQIPTITQTKNPIAHYVECNTKKH